MTPPNTPAEVEERVKKMSEVGNKLFAEIRATDLTPIEIVLLLNGMADTANHALFAALRTTDTIKPLQPEGNA